MLSKPSGPTSKATKNETKNFATVGLSHDLTRTKRDDSKKNSFTLVSCLFGVSRKNDETNYSMKSNELKKSFLSNTKRLSAIPVTSQKPGNRRKEAKRLQTQNTIFFGPRVFSTTKKWFIRKKMLLKIFSNHKNRCFRRDREWIIGQLSLVLSCRWNYSENSMNLTLTLPTVLNFSDR